MTQDAKITLKTLYTNKVIALRKFEKYSQEVESEDELWKLNDACDDTARWFEQAVEREVEKGNTHPMEVIREMQKWDAFIAERINHPDNAGLI